MSTSIPPRLTADHILGAISDIEAGIADGFDEPTKYEMVFSLVSSKCVLRRRRMAWSWSCEQMTVELMTTPSIAGPFSEVPDSIDCQLGSYCKRP